MLSIPDDPEHDEYESGKLAESTDHGETNSQSGHTASWIVAILAAGAGVDAFGLG